MKRSVARILICWMCAFAGVFVAAPVDAMGCAIQTTLHVVFGQYDPRADSALDTAGTVSYECSDVGASDRITITLGRSEDGGFFPRRMTNRGSQLAYNVYVDAARTRVWGDGTSGTTVYEVRPPESQAVSVPIFARIPARQNALVGTYRDSVTLTILF